MLQSFDDDCVFVNAFARRCAAERARNVERQWRIDDIVAGRVDKQFVVVVVVFIVVVVVVVVVVVNGRTDIAACRLATGSARAGF